MSNNQGAWILFEEGIGHFRKGNGRKALECLQLAYEMDRENARIASYYGRVLAAQTGDIGRGLELCTWAMKKEKEASHFLNLGKVYEISGNIAAAKKVYGMGLQYFPKDEELQEECWGYSRGEPMISFLDRAHELNRRLGILFRRLLPVWEDRQAVKAGGKRLGQEEIRERLHGVFKKIATGKVTREGGAIFIRDLLREADAELVTREIGLLTVFPPEGVYVKTILHTVMLTGNDVFTDLFSKFLSHRDAEIAVFAARGLGRFGSADAFRVLERHLNHEDYHCRKVAALGLVEGFGKEGIEVLKWHILEVNGFIYKMTSIEAMLRSKKGVEGLVELMSRHEEAYVPEFVREVVRGYVLHRPEEMFFLKETLLEIIKAGEETPETAAAKEMLRVLEKVDLEQKKEIAMEAEDER